ncbi:unnamed protein product [Heligmosomoides polygyrus]|uniref:DUF3421 domain-containing protein n=1 Tax=Heligmosomoides polygyrus TaxID=6339 RepID=A0A183FBM7_HELPZ|nr:unnamed protein product [Heligmosomoides polygyrus]
MPLDKDKDKGDYLSCYSFANRFILWNAQPYISRHGRIRGVRDGTEGEILHAAIRHWQCAAVRRRNPDRSRERETLNTQSVLLAGAVAPDGTCEGAPYSDQYGSWSKVIVQATVRVRATRYLAQVNTKTDVIHLQHGVQCPWSKGYCMDAEAGEIYWKSSPIDGCAQENFVILYEGSATEVRQAPVSEASPDRVTYLVEQGEKIFALERTRSYADCPFNIYLTSTHRRHPVRPRLLPLSRIFSISLAHCLARLC